MKASTLQVNVMVGSKSPYLQHHQQLTCLKSFNTFNFMGILISGMPQKKCDCLFSTFWALTKSSSFYDFIHQTSCKIQALPDLSNWISYSESESQNVRNVYMPKVLHFYTQFLLMTLIVAKWIKSVTEKAISSITDVNLYLVKAKYTSPYFTAYQILFHQCYMKF